MPLPPPPLERPAEPSLGTLLWAWAPLPQPEGAASRLVQTVSALHEDAKLRPVSPLRLLEAPQGPIAAVLLAESHCSGRVDLQRGGVWVDLFSCLGLDLDQARRSLERAWPGLQWQLGWRARGPRMIATPFAAGALGYTLLPRLFRVQRGDQEAALACSGFELGEGTLTLEFHFEPQGYSALRFGPKGQLALHTWPEHGLVAVDQLLRDAAPWTAPEAWIPVGEDPHST